MSSTNTLARRISFNNQSANVPSVSFTGSPLTENLYCMTFLFANVEKEIAAPLVENFLSTSSAAIFPETIAAEYGDIAGGMLRSFSNS
jgi:hypothetical protein